MSALLSIWDVIGVVGMWATVVVIVRRPRQRWKLARAGKVISVLGVLTISFHLGPVLIPAGTITALVRHRKDRGDSSLVPLADAWPGR